MRFYQGSVKLLKTNMLMIQLYSYSKENLKAIIWHVIKTPRAHPSHPLSCIRKIQLKNV